MRAIPHLRWAALPLAVVLLAGCTALPATEPKLPPKRLTHGRLVYLAGRACARAERGFRVASRRLGTNPDTNRATLRHVFVPTYERLVFVLHGLTPPAAEEAAFRRLRATFNYEDQVLHHLLDAAEAGDVPRVKRLGKRLDRLDKRITRRAAGLGFRTCAKS